MARLTSEQFIHAVVGPYAHFLLAEELSELSAGRRSAAADFAVHRVATMPSVMRFGATAIATVFRLLLVLPTIGPPAARWLAQHPLPLLGEYPRLVRSLTFAYVWETWPNTTATGGQ